MKYDNEIIFTRELLCAVIEQAFEDARNDTVYESKEPKRAQGDQTKGQQLLFLNTPFYADLCEALGDAAGVVLPSKKIKQKALS